MAVARWARRVAKRPGDWRVGRLGRADRLAMLFVCVVGVMTAGAATAAAAQLSQASFAGSMNYAALGDSYSSGVGTGVYDAASGPCLRSPFSYPPLWAAEHHPATFTFVACAGATTADILASQISAVGSTTDLVTITVGGNDAGFAPVLQTCTVARSDLTCIAAVDAAEAFELFVLPARLARVYAAIRGAAPHAQVVVLGYPRLFEPTPDCTDQQVPNLVRRRKLNEGGDVLDTVIRIVAQRYGFGFTDVRERFAGHGVCSTNPWINGPNAPTSVGPYHPTQAGYHDGYLEVLDSTTARRSAAALRWTSPPVA